MLFALAVTWVDFVAFLLSKIHEGRVIAMAAFMFFLLTGNHFKEVNKRFGKTYESCLPLFPTSNGEAGLNLAMLKNNEHDKTCTESRNTYLYSCIRR